MLTDAGIRLAAFGTGAGWVKHKLQLADADTGRRNEAKEFVRSIIAALRSIDYQGYLCAKAFLYPDPHEAARQTMRAYKYWTPA